MNLRNKKLKNFFFKNYNSKLEIQLKFYFKNHLITYVSPLVKLA